jgi:hydroxymethylglutaryl-CoA reductase
MCEKLAPVLEEMTGGEVILRIISNLADRRLASARAVFPKKELGEETVRRIVLAHSLAEADAYRAATHNKGIMNGVIAVALATGNDTRALEAGAHTYASRSGRYRPLTTWRKDSSGDLVGTIEMPMAVGVVGGITRSHPIARTSLKILGVKSAKELAEVMAAVGLAQNLAALRALATEGIQRGHMKLHARNVAAHAGAKGELIDRIADIMVNEGKINAARAKELMEKTN